MRAELEAMKLREGHRSLTAGEQCGALVVVIEDEAIVLIGYQMLFESWGYLVIGASSADEVLLEIKKSGRCPDIILADYRLQDGLTGVDAIRKVQDVCNKNIPGILITGDTGAERLREVAASGLPILHKPVNGNQLRDVLQNHLASGIG